MNKTVKTIAWICLVLGLLGMAVDVGVYVKGRSLVAQHQEAFEVGEMPAFRSRFTDVDGDIDDDWDKGSVDRSDWFADGGMMSGRKGIDTFSNSHGYLPGMRDGGFGSVGFALPFLFLVSGPVLAIVGTVILIVNREPKIEDSSVKKEKSKKK
ncbi:MAG: hypothetical protein Q7J07_02085 [Pelolinea sp.]|nr:hypothetical protein [Pelolinea sp.]